ncbi:MAG: hypothetical protein JWP57_4320 [Spirosoma sp.]|nr:hypothetical protein [Spirosoma sp.]
MTYSLVCMLPKLCHTERFHVCHCSSDYYKDAYLVRRGELGSGLLSFVDNAGHILIELTKS